MDRIINDIQYIAISQRTLFKIGFTTMLHSFVSLFISPLIHVLHDIVLRKGGSILCNHC